MAASSSSLGLPSDSFNDNLSDKEIFSNDGDYGTGKHGATKKPPIISRQMKNDLDVSFDINESINGKPKAFSRKSREKFE